MNDIAFCKGEKCPQRDNCWRYIAGMLSHGDNWWVGPRWDGKKCKLYMGN